PISIRTTGAIVGEEPEKSQDTQIVLGNTRRRVPNEADIALLDIGETTDQVDHIAFGVDIERVDREVAAFRVCPPIGTEGYLCTPPIGFHVCPQRRDLERLAIDDEGHSA